jgi:zinc transport system substrate-binding protein
MTAMTRSNRHAIAGPSFALAAVLCLLPTRLVAADLDVVVTIKPIHALVAAVMEGVGQPRLLIDGAGSPHTFTLKPSDAKALNGARVVFRVSESLEPFTARLARSLPKSVQLVTLEAAPGLTLHDLRTGAAFESHAHAGKADKHTHGHAHGAAADAKGGRDGHIWLDPDNAKVIARHVAETLAGVAPIHAERFRTNALTLVTKLDALTPDIERQLAPVAAKPYVVFHDAYQYFEHRFGLAAVGSVTVSPDVSPSVKRLSELRAKIRQSGAVCVFSEPQFEPRIVETVVEGTAVRRGVLDPLGAAIPAGPDHYFQLLRSLAGNLVACLDKPA